MDGVTLERSDEWRIKRRVATTVVVIFLLYIGIEVGGNGGGGAQHWYTTTWRAIWGEWLVIAVALALTWKETSFVGLWRKYRIGITLWILWMAVVLASYLDSPYYSWSNPLALMRLTETFTHPLLFIALCLMGREGLLALRPIWVVQVLPALVMLGYFLYLGVTRPELFSTAHDFSLPDGTLWINTHFHRIGYQVEAAIGFSLAWVFSPSKRERWIGGMIAGALFLFLLWLGGRAAILGLVAGVVVGLIYLYGAKAWKPIVAFLLGSLALTGLLLALLPETSSPWATIHQSLHFHSLNHLSSGRIAVWEMILEKLHGHWLLGTGSQSFFFYPGRSPEVIHAHNFIMQFLGEWDILGFGLLVVVLYVLLRNVWESNKKRNTYLPNNNTASIVVLTTFFISSLFGGIFFFSQTSIEYIVVFFTLDSRRWGRNIIDKLQKALLFYQRSFRLGSIFLKRQGSKNRGIEKFN